MRVFASLTPTPAADPRDAYDAPDHQPPRRPRLDAVGQPFHIPPTLIPDTPPERRGIPRDRVRLLVAHPDRLLDSTFDRLGDHLTPGDLLVVNTSATRPSAVPGTLASTSRPVVLHLSTQDGPGMRWIVELRQADGRGPLLDARAGDVIDMPDGARARLGEAVAAGPAGEGTRLWKAHLVLTDHQPLHRWLARVAHPITYGPHAPIWPLEDHQTVFAQPSGRAGSAEMPSAARPFSPLLVTDLIARGITIAPLRLDAGVSSQEAGEPPLREWIEVPEHTADLVTQTRAAGGRVIAVGTTVVRALESATNTRGRTRRARGWTDLVITAGRGARVVDGLITGWHEPESSHLHMLHAIAGPHLVDAAYAHALRRGYAWHHFGDSCLLLP